MARWSDLPIDHDGEERATVELLRSLIRIDTTNPPGNEREAAELVADELRKDGIEPELFDTAPGRACVVARLRGDGSAPPLLLTAHLDVVEADPARWSHPPFEAQIHDGYVWGRGAIDMKHMAAMSVMVLKLLARTRTPLARDVVFAGVADEEAGCEHGSLWLVREKPDLVRAEYMLGEVGAFSMELLGRTFYPIQVAEKGFCWIKARVRGEPGHGSVPRPDSAVVRLSEMVARLGHARFAHRATPPMVKFLDAVSEHLPFPVSRIMPLLASPYVGPRLLDRALRDPGQRRTLAASFANTATPTVVRAGNKTNVIPGEASVEIDGRYLPGESVESFLAELRAVVGEDAELEVMRALDPVETTTETPLYAHLARTIRAHDPQGIPVPYMIPGFTDAKAFSKLGTRCYGFAPVRFDPAHQLVFSKLYHGNDERIPVDGLKWGVRVLWDAVDGFCGKS